MTDSMTNSLLIKGARVLLPNDDFQIVDVLTQAETITAIEADIDPSRADQVIQAEGLTLLPGMIDPQVHFREPGLEHKEDLATASRACAKGGITAFLEMPNTRPLTITQANLDDKLQRAAAKSLVNYGFFIGATKEVLPDLLTANPVCGIKIFMGSMHGDLLMDDPEILEKIFAEGKRLIAVHAEDQVRINSRRQEFANEHHVSIHSVIQDNTAALLATKFAVSLSKKYERRLHILHLSTAEEATFLRQEKPAWVTAEVTPQHLLLNTSAY
ncbi:MAG: amidohydrolase family protein, partial [Microcoleaceae cyanobacterium]